jgi:hypothetical protein
VSGQPHAPTTILRRGASGTYLIRDFVDTLAVVLTTIIIIKMTMTTTMMIIMTMIMIVIIISNKGVCTFPRNLNQRTNRYLILGNKHKNSLAPLSFLCLVFLSWIILFGWFRIRINSEIPINTFKRLGELVDGKLVIVNHFKIMIHILSLVFHMCHKDCLQT